jgi:hypothetical protein
MKINHIKVKVFRDITSNKSIRANKYSTSNPQGERNKVTFFVLWIGGFSMNILKNLSKCQRVSILVIDLQFKKDTVSID